MNTVEACEGMLAGSVKAFFGLGGNFVRAIPERVAMEEAWVKMELTVQIATKLNRSHLVNGRSAYLLPCRGRTEQDIQVTGPQAVTMEDTFSCVQGSVGLRKPASEHLKSELEIGTSGSAIMALSEISLPKPIPTNFTTLTRACSRQVDSTGVMRRASEFGKPRAARPSSRSQTLSPRSGSQTRRAAIAFSRCAATTSSTPPFTA
jgi:hypothetical protein